MGVGVVVGQKDPPIIFSPVTSTNVGISPQNILTFSFNPFASLIFKPEPRPPLKKAFFWSNLYKIEVLITSLIEMLQLPNIGRMNTSTI